MRRKEGSEGRPPRAASTGNVGRPVTLGAPMGAESLTGVGPVSPTALVVDNSFGDVCRGVSLSRGPYVG